MQITIDTTQPVGDVERAILQILLGEKQSTVVTEPAKVPAEKPASKPASKPAAKPAPEPEPEDDEDEAEEDLLGGDGVTREQVVALATSLVADGKAAVLRAALTAVKAKKVTDVPDEKLQQVYDALNA